MDSVAAHQSRVLIRVRQVVRHFGEFSCSLADYLETEFVLRGFFSWNTIVMLFGVAVAKVTQTRDTERGSPFTRECFVVIYFMV